MVDITPAAAAPTLTSPTDQRSPQGIVLWLPFEALTPASANAANPIDNRIHNGVRWAPSVGQPTRPSTPSAAIPSRQPTRTSIADSPPAPLEILNGANASPASDETLRQTITRRSPPPLVRLDDIAALARKQLELGEQLRERAARADRERLQLKLYSRASSSCTRELVARSSSCAARASSLSSSRAITA